MASLLDIIRPTPESIQQMIMQQQLARQQQSAPVTLSQDNGDNADYLTQLQESPVYSPPSRGRARLPIQSIPDAAPAFEPTTGAKMEADSHSSIDDLMSQLAAQRDQYRNQDRNQQWMSFFSKLASSKSPTILGGLGEGAQALTDTIGKQSANNQLLDQAALQDQIKYREWQQDQQRQQQLADQTGTYQQGELGLRKAALAQDNIAVIPDGLGGFIQYDKRHPDSIKAIAGASGAIPQPDKPAVDANGQPLTGDDYLKTLDPRIARTAKMVANGDMAWPGGFALKSPYWQNVIAAAQTYDPTANGNRFPAVKQFNTGKQGDQVRAFDVGVSHLNTLSTLADALDNNDTKLLNTAANTWKTQTGQEAPTDFNAAKNVVGSEIVKAIVGAGGGVTDREKAQKDLDAANSPAQLKGVIDTYKTLMKGQLGGLKQQYENSTGRKDFYDRISPSSRDVVMPIEKSTDSGSASSKTIHFNDLPE